MKKILENSKFEDVIKIPASKSYSHRAIIASALSQIDTRIINLGDSVDVNATLEAFKAIGVISNKNDHEVNLSGKISFPESVVIDCKESGSTLRFLVPIFAALGVTTTFNGEGKLPYRPMDDLIACLKEHGIHVETPKGKVLPMKIYGKLSSGVFKLPGNVSSQYISGLLFALPLIDGRSEIQLTTKLESVDYVNMTVDVLTKYGIKIETFSDRFIVEGNQTYSCSEYHVEGDYSNAAFFFAGGVLGFGAKEIHGLSRDSLQGDQEIIRVIRDAGGKVSYHNGVYKVDKSSLKGGRIDVSDIPDLLPILTVLFCFAHDETIILGGERVRLKESDRINAICSELIKMGADVVETQDGVIIRPVKYLTGAVVDGWNDHRIVMALTVASMMARGQTIIEGANAINKSFPTFYDHIINRGNH